MEWYADGPPQVEQPLLIQNLVWHGTQEKYQIFDTLGGRFNSEFGMEAFPHIQTIKKFVTDENELYPQSHTLDFHNKGMQSQCCSDAVRDWLLNCIS